MKMQMYQVLKIKVRIVLQSYVYLQIPTLFISDHFLTFIMKELKENLIKYI